MTSPRYRARVRRGRGCYAFSWEGRRGWTRDPSIRRRCVALARRGDFELSLVPRSRTSAIVAASSRPPTTRPGLRSCLTPYVAFYLLGMLFMLFLGQPLLAIFWLLMAWGMSYERR